MKKTIYLAGPMRGIPESNYPAFNAAAKCLRECRGFEVQNPAENFNGSTDVTYEECMRADIPMLLRADGIALLPDWQHSEGARVEATVAEATGKEFYLLKYLFTQEDRTHYTLHSATLAEIHEIRRDAQPKAETGEKVVSVSRTGRWNIAEIPLTQQKRPDAVDWAASLNGFVTKDSGARSEYGSGMVRDTQDGKPRFDLLWPEGIPYPEQMLTRFAALMERGAQKYDARNWEQANSAEELERFKQSAARHFAQWLTGEDDEDHAAAVMFNVMAFETTRTKMVLWGSPGEEDPS